MARALRVGIIGVSAEGGWARESHVPAVHNLAGLELAAVASSDQAKAKAAAKAFGAMERI
jgi:predicted dehydrogenase